MIYSIVYLLLATIIAYGYFYAHMMSILSKKERRLLALISDVERRLNEEMNKRNSISRITK